MRPGLCAQWRVIEEEGCGVGLKMPLDIPPIPPKPSHTSTCIYIFFIYIVYVYMYILYQHLGYYNNGPRILYYNNGPRTDFIGRPLHDVVLRPLEPAHTAHSLRQCGPVYACYLLRV